MEHSSIVHFAPLVAQNKSDLLHTHLALAGKRFNNYYHLLLLGLERLLNHGHLPKGRHHRHSQL